MQVNIDMSSAMAASSIDNAELAKLVNLETALEAYFEQLLCDSSGTLIVNVDFDETTANTDATTGAFSFINFLPDVRVNLRDQAFDDFKEDDEELYDILPSQSGMQDVNYVMQDNVPRSTRYIATRDAQAEQLVLFQNPVPSDPPEAFISVRMEAGSNGPFVLDFAGHFRTVSGQGVESTALEALLIHEVSHALGLTSRASASVDVLGDGFEQCEMADIGSRVVYCDNWITLLDAFRYPDSFVTLNMGVHPLQSDIFARGSQRRLAAAGADNAVMVQRFGTIDDGRLTPGAIQMQASATSAALPPSPGVNHTRAPSAQSQLPAGWSIGLLEAVAGGEYRTLGFAGNVNTGEYGTRSRMSRSDAKLLDIQGWNIDTDGQIGTWLFWLRRSLPRMAPCLLRRMQRLRSIRVDLKTLRTWGFLRDLLRLQKIKCISPRLLQMWYSRCPTGRWSKALATWSTHTKTRLLGPFRVPQHR